MKTTKDLFSGYKVLGNPEDVQRGGIQCELHEQVQAICDLMGYPVGSKDNHRQFKKWLGRTSGMSADSIFRMLKNARTGKNPQAFFEWLFKKERS